MMNHTITLLNFKRFFYAVPSTNFNTFGIKFLSAKSTCRQNGVGKVIVGKVIATRIFLFNLLIFFFILDQWDMEIEQQVFLFNLIFFFFILDWSYMEWNSWVC